MGFDTLKNLWTANEASIMTWTGAGLLLFGTVEAVRNTPEAMRKIDIRETREKKELTLMEKAQTVWRTYLPVIVTDVTGVVLIALADNKHHQRNAALMTGMTISQQALREYKDEVKETLGEKKAAEVEDNIVKRKMEQHPPREEDVIQTGRGKSLCYDPYCDRYFTSSAEAIRQAVLNINRDLVSGNDVEVDDFYSELGLNGTLLTERRGWNAIEHQRGDIDVFIIPHMGPNDTPCTSFRFNYPPEMHTSIWP